MKREIVFLLFLAFTKLKGITFSSNKYVIILTADYPEGGIGKVKIRDNPEVIYSITTVTPLMQIDEDTGALTLLKRMDKSNTDEFNNTELTIKAITTDQLQSQTTKIVLIILPLYIGDQFGPQMMEVAKTGVKENHIIYSKAGESLQITADILRRSQRYISGNDVHISLAETRLEKAIALTKAIILKVFEKRFGDNAVFGFFHIKQLFSSAVMTKLDRESSCSESTVSDPTTCLVKSVFRRIDGKCNNLNHPNIGAAGTAFARIRPALYFDADGLNDPIDFPNLPNAPDVPSPFKVSRDFIKDEVATSAAPDLAAVVMQFGQFLDHDLDLTGDSEGSDECADISCDGSQADFKPPCYPIFPLPGEQRPCIRFARSAAICQEEGYPMAREQINEITSFIDGSQIYGSSKDSAQSLKDDQGFLRVSEGNLLPLDETGEANVCEQGCFVAGDIRANEQQGLTSFQTLFLREHNSMAKKIKEINTHWDGERVYQETRKIMGAVLQKIVYVDYLPLILGPGGIPCYTGYDEDINPSILNVFATAAYRFGHSTIRSTFDLLNANFDPIDAAIKLRFLFFNNTITKNYGIEPILLGLVGNASQKVDRILTKEITDHLFARGNELGQNLAALNIQRSRDHGLPGYNEFRKLYGLSDAKTFDDTKNEIQDPQNRIILKRLYNNDPNLAELWVAGLAERPVPGGSVGPIFKNIIADQFRRTRDGDRFFYKRKGVFSKRQLKEISKASLSSIYCDNLENIVSIQENAFKTPTESNRRISCERISRINFCAWKECFVGEPHFNAKTGNCSCKCKTPWPGTGCDRPWTFKPNLTPPFHIAADNHGDLGARFVDLNGDGRMDLVFHRWINSKNIQKGAYLNVPDVGFLSAPQFTPPFHIAADGYGDLGARFVDLNGDGKIDLVFHRWINSKYQQKGAYLNTGSGWENAPQFTPPFHIAADGYGDLGARFIDLNGDGKIDFVYHRWINGNYQQKGAFLNTGHGWKLAPKYIPPFHIAADKHGDLGVRFEDLNGDGRMDMVYHRFISGTVQQKGAYLNDGNKWVWAPQFTPPFHIAADGHGDLGARFVDLNRDGKIDMVYHRWINKNLQQKGAYINNGKGWQSTPAYIPPFHIAADGHRDLGARFADVTGDGLVDFVYHRWINGNTQQKGAYINTGCGWKFAPEFTPPFHIAADGYGDLGARFVELNGDGAVDLAYHRWINANAIQKGAYLACMKAAK